MENQQTKIYDATGNEMPITLDLLQTLVKQNFPEYGIVTKESVISLANKTTELQTIVTQSVEIIVLFSDLVGNKLPSKATDLIAFVPAFTKRVMNKPESVNEIQKRIENIAQLAPKHLEESVISKLEAFAPKQIQQTNE